MVAPPAVLADPSGPRLALEVLKYQFPDDTSDSANWLIIRLTANDGYERWSATDAALETGDLASLATWLRAIAVGAPYPHKTDFIEPCLALEAVGAGEEAEITAILGYAFRPLRIPEFEESRLRVRPSIVGLHRCENALEAAFASFPTRQ